MKVLSGDDLRKEKKYFQKFDVWSNYGFLSNMGFSGMKLRRSYLFQSNTPKFCWVKTGFQKGCFWRLYTNFGCTNLSMLKLNQGKSKNVVYLRIILLEITNKGLFWWYKIFLKSFSSWFLLISNIFHLQICDIKKKDVARIWNDYLKVSWICQHWWRHIVIPGNDVLHEY